MQDWITSGLAKFALSNANQTSVPESGLQNNCFVILCRSRTGSNWVGSLLNSHTRIVCLGEIFRPKSFAKRTVQLGCLAFLRRHYPERRIGFKLFYYHSTAGFDQQSLWRYIVSNRISVVHLLRLNLLGSICSRELALRNNIWFEDNGSVSRSHSNNSRVKLDVDQVRKEVIDTLNQIRAARQAFSNCNYIELVYEDIVENRSRNLERVQEFLGVPIEELGSPLRRQETRKLSEVVENYLEITKGLADLQNPNDFILPPE